MAAKAHLANGAAPAVDGPDPRTIETLRATLAQLNAGLGEVTPYKLDLVPPGELEDAPRNAHYMPKRIFYTLTDNIRRDGNLSSLPLCWRRADGRYMVISGHHRRDSAKKAGVPYILILYTDREMTEGQRISMQLSHNALVGQDNPALLRELWNQIDAVDWKAYSGLDEELLATMEPIEIGRVTEAQVRFEELTLLFLPAEIDRIKGVLKRLGSVNKTRLAVPVEEWDRFFDALLDFKEAQGIMNTATGFTLLIDIAEEWLRRHAEEQAEQQAEQALGAGAEEAAGAAA